MPNTTDSERVEHHIRDIEERLAEAVSTVAALESAGQPVEKRQAFTAFLEEALAMSQEHLARLRADAT
ncbi:MAG: hypothetical protein E5V62_03880 [Mesorhizobium sp.]|uniref:hypothetical protein n=1 Tax=Mesorhizobium sp. TaxID=1871066 RepID=UPI000FD5AB3D|nr:hypothetical protein [Mesorhizobium sp.]RVD67267.1 hypothetical protein EN751_37695 [Mesorhizobium sp. M4A.F.Ca.ET.029.04.2.1]TIW37031.1 MAG: hypothetical protein E5V62_03880 [Mesorhizobium sp.]